MTWGWWIGETMGSAIDGAVYRYTHRSTTLPDDIARGAAIALSGTGLFDPAAFRGWIAKSAALQADLAGSLVQSGDGYQATIDPRQATEPWRADAAALLARTAEILAENSAISTDRVPVHPSTSSGEVGAWPVAVVAVLVVGAVAGIGWCGYQAAQVIDRQLARSEAARELVRTDELAQQLLGAHLQRERAAGRSLSLDAATVEALQALRERQRLAAPHAPPLPVPSSSAGVFGGGFSAGLLVAAAVFAVFWFAPLAKG